MHLMRLFAVLAFSALVGVTLTGLCGLGDLVLEFLLAPPCLDFTQRVLGPEFDLTEFHDVVLSGGPRPLSLLEQDVERWYISKVDLSD